MQLLQYKIMLSVVQNEAFQFQNQALAELLSSLPPLPPDLSCNNAADY